MTCIVGVAHQGKVFIGGDSAGVGGYDVTMRADRKVFRNGDFLIGFTSSFRMGQLLQYAFVPPPRYPKKDLMAYMVTDFAKSVRDCLKTGGFARKDAEAENGGIFLVGCEGRLFRVDCDYQVGESASGYDAVGCGENYAKGVLFFTKKLAPEERVLPALEAAAEHSAGVRGPFHIESI